MKINRLRHVWILGLLISSFIISGCAGSNSLYSVNMYYDAKQATIPSYLNADGKASSVVISLAEFTDTRQMDDRMVIGHVIEQNGTKALVFPQSVKATEVIPNGIKRYLRKAGYKVSDRMEQWDLKEENIPKGDSQVIIGGKIEELEVSCRKGFPANAYDAHIKLAIVIANAADGKILYKSKVENSYTREYVLFSEEYLGEQASVVVGDAIEKLFEDRVVAQKLKEAIMK